MDRVRKQLGIEEIDASSLGEAVTVALLDTGIVSHPDFSDRIIGFKDFVHGHNVNYDDAGHGTHVEGR